VQPPKSPNRSGKSTPTRGKSVDKKDEELDAETLRLKAEEEERKRIHQEVTHCSFENNKLCLNVVNFCCFCHHC